MFSLYEKQTLFFLEVDLGEYSCSGDTFRKQLEHVQIDHPLSNPTNILIVDIRDIVDPTRGAFHKLEHGNFTRNRFGTVILHVTQVDHHSVLIRSVRLEMFRRQRGI